MEIPYAIVGSVASSSHGIPRTTLDVDLVVDLQPEQIDGFTAELCQEFYADAALIREAFARGRAANLIHLGTGLKFDLFPLQQDEYSRVAFGRRTFREIRPDRGEAGGETSERQWNDLRGVCGTASSQLDVDYLHQWASHLKIEDLLERLLAEFGM